MVRGHSQFCFQYEQELMKANCWTGWRFSHFLSVGKLGSSITPSQRATLSLGWVEIASNRELPWPLELALSLARQERSYATAVYQWVGGPFLELLCAAPRLGSAPLQAVLVGPYCVSAGGLTRESRW